MIPKFLKINKNMDEMPKPEDFNKKSPEEEFAMPENQEESKVPGKNLSEAAEDLFRKAPEKEKIIEQCSWCEEFFGDNAKLGEAFKKGELPDFKLSHIICKDCYRNKFEKQFEELKRELGEKGKNK